MPPTSRDLVPARSTLGVGSTFVVTLPLRYTDRRHGGHDVARA